MRFKANWWSWQFKTHPDFENASIVRIETEVLKALVIDDTLAAKKVLSLLQ